jgi:hypothetical protein
MKLCFFNRINLTHVSSHYLKWSNIFQTGKAHFDFIISNGLLEKRENYREEKSERKIKQKTIKKLKPQIRFLNVILRRNADISKAALPNKNKISNLKFISNLMTLSLSLAR